MQWRPRLHLFVFQANLFLFAQHKSLARNHKGGVSSLGASLPDWNGNPFEKDFYTLNEKKDLEACDFPPHTHISPKLNEQHCWHLVNKKAKGTIQ